MLIEAIVLTTTLCCHIHSDIPPPYKLAVVC